MQKTRDKTTRIFIIWLIFKFDFDELRYFHNVYNFCIDDDHKYINTQYNFYRDHILQW